MAIVYTPHIPVGANLLARDRVCAPKSCRSSRAPRGSDSGWPDTPLSRPRGARALLQGWCWLGDCGLSDTPPSRPSLPPIAPTGIACVPQIPVGAHRGYEASDSGLSDTTRVTGSRGCHVPVCGRRRSRSTATPPRTQPKYPSTAALALARLSGLNDRPIPSDGTG